MFQPPRGTRDFLPEEMLKRNWVIDRVREVFEAYGFEPLGTPAFESWDLLKVKSGEDTINQIYYFKDKSDRELGLRFEWTASLARVVASHRDLPRPFKRYAIGPVWRYERPSEARRREFWQMDVDVVGVARPIADAEVLACAVNALENIGFKGFIIKLNDRRILSAFIEVAGMPKDRSLDIIRGVDKLNKIGRDGVIEELSKIVPHEEVSIKLLDFLAIKGESEEVLSKAKERLRDIPDGVSACNELLKLVEYSESFGFAQYVEVDLSLARGLDYYTGVVYEILAQGHEDYGSIAGGGRYDEIIGLFGGDPTPATGVSLGLERLVPLLDIKGAFRDLELGTEVYVAAVSEAVRPEAIKIAQSLRRSGVPTTFDLLGRRLSRQFETADRKGVRRVVIVGERELRDGCVSVRDMASGEQVKVSLEGLVEYFKP